MGYMEENIYSSSQPFLNKNVTGINKITFTIVQSLPQYVLLWQKL